jgi:hypothetical protein
MKKRASGFERVFCKGDIVNLRGDRTGMAIFQRRDPFDPNKAYVTLSTGTEVLRLVAEMNKVQL